MARMSSSKKTSEVLLAVVIGCVLGIALGYVIGARSVELPTELCPVITKPQVQVPPARQQVQTGVRK